MNYQSKGRGHNSTKCVDVNCQLNINSDLFIPSTSLHAIKHICERNVHGFDFKRLQQGIYCFATDHKRSLLAYIRQSFAYHL